MSEAKRPKNTSKKHIADVQEPGTSAPPETSRPVIVANRPLLRDPMVVDKKDGEKNEKLPQKPSETLSLSGKPELRPLDDSITPDEESAGSDVQEAETPDMEQQSLADEAETVPAPGAAPEDPIAQTVNNDTSRDDPVSDLGVSKEDKPARSDGQPAADAPKTAAVKKAETEAAEQAKHDAALQKLVDSKQYVLPISAVEKRQTKRFVSLGIGLSVLLILVWLDIALDAGIVKLGGLNPITHFFSN